MTVRKRLRKSNLHMFLIPMLTAALLLLLGGGIAIYILETNYLPKIGLNLREMHLMLEQYEGPLQSFETFVWIYVGAVGMALILTILFTNVYLTRELFSHISKPLDILVEGVERIRSGDLDHPICYSEPDEFKAACDAVDMMAAKLKASLEAEQRRQQSSKELIAGMSHDLKSPLTSIRAYTEALLEGVADTPEAQKKYLGTIYTKESEMEHMVARLLEFSKLELSEYPTKAESFELRGELERIVSDMSPEAEIDLSGISGAEVTADREQLRRIVENIIGNSVKYCPKGARIDISSQCADGFVRIKFSDNGPGVPDEALPKLFDLFYRADPARVAPGSGSGLGLSIVKRSVEQMGGHAFAEKGENGGLCIVIDLPGGNANG
jgi:signal transduction histidine kinase